MGLISENHPGITEEIHAGSFLVSPPPLSVPAVADFSVSMAAVLSSSSLGLFRGKSVAEASWVDMDAHKER